MYDVARVREAVHWVLPNLVESQVRDPQLRASAPVCLIPIARVSPTMPTHRAPLLTRCVVVELQSDLINMPKDCKALLRFEPFAPWVLFCSIWFDRPRGSHTDHPPDCTYRRSSVETTTAFR